MGTSVGSVLNDIDFYREFRDKGSAPMDSVNLYLEGNLSSGIHSFLETEGPSITVVNACASGTNAIGVAMSWLRTGLCDIAIAGGADELNKVPFCGFGSLGILSDSLCSPFDLNRNGLNLGEGAGVLLLESERSMKERKKKPRAIMRGYDFSNDAHHLTSPDPSGAGLERAITGALIDANLKPDSISFINAHGTATIDNDLVEARILYNLFGSTIAFLSTKGYTGHTLAAAGALEAGFCILALEQGWIPGCAGFKKLDPDIPIAPVTQKAQIEGRFALSTSMGFGGCDAALVIESPEQEGDI
jgi:3-oxoacyl-(acyl-carrier-protein) synthase